MADILTDTADDILFRAMKALKNTSILNRTSPGSKLRTLLAIIATELERTQEVAQANALLSMLGGASGPFLDFMGELLGVSRGAYDTASVNPNEKAIIIRPPSGVATFGELNNNLDILIPAGTTIGSENQAVTYRITSALRLKAAGTVAYTGAIATSPGTNGNVIGGVLNSLNFSGYSSYPGNKLVVTNVSAIQSGTNREADTLYRFRIQQSAIANRGCNFTSLRMAMLALPGVDDIRIIDLARGVGTADVILETSSMEISPRLQAQAEAQVQRIKAVGMDIAIQLPVFVGIKLECSVGGGQSSFRKREIRQAIQSQLRTMVASLDIGEGLSLNNLAARLQQSHPDITSMGRPGRAIEKIVLYRKSPFSGNRTATILSNNSDIKIAPEERLVLEGSVDAAVSVSFT
jgi:uncharacterized phage protein gp47/JayE